MACVAWKFFSVWTVLRNLSIRCFLSVLRRWVFSQWLKSLWSLWRLVCLDVRIFLWDLQSRTKTCGKINDLCCHGDFFPGLSKHLYSTEGCHVCVSATSWLLLVTAGCTLLFQVSVVSHPSSIAPPSGWFLLLQAVSFSGLGCFCFMVVPFFWSLIPNGVTSFWTQGLKFVSVPAFF